MQATPMQLGFGQDAILNVKHEANWEYIHERKEKPIKKNNEKQNKKRKLHHYQVIDKVLAKGDRSTKFGDYAYKGPYEIMKVNGNGTVKIRKGS
eukprot:7401211-Ditylum_brightwellii.AAC.1